MEGNPVVVREKQLHQDMYYKNQIIMKYTIKYPQFISATYQAMANKLNSLYRTKAYMYEKSNIINLYQMAMVEYEYSVANHFPIRQFDAYVDFTVTYNEDCIVSLYFDQYEYAGGAHGLTIRYSDTWDMLRSKRIELNELFHNKSNYREMVLSEIDQQIASQIDGEASMYFDDYAKLVRDNFKANNFYLTEEGVVIYFQQYDIAAYAAGLPTFLLPYGGMVQLPSCKN